MLLPTQSNGDSYFEHQRKSKLEQSICGLKEPFIFWLWSSAAGKPNASRIANIANIEDVSLTTSDGRVLRGYKLGATPAAGAGNIPRGYLLVVQGNAMLADQIIGSFVKLTDLGYDVYVFDFRGYGRSDGKRRLKAILSDYRELIEHLDSHAYAQRAFYGMSLGGVILLDALRNRSRNATVVIDSAPSRLSDYGCPTSHDPVNNLPGDASGLLVITGARDTVVTPAMSRDLSTQAEQHGAQVLRHPEFGHPFMDYYTDRRMAILGRFLTGRHDLSD
jgi:pimeloyl-ACP methyl ester carboxylesterase